MARPGTGRAGRHACNRGTTGCPSSGILDNVSDVLTIVLSAVTSAAVAYVTTLAKTRGEIKKLRAERDEAHFSHRQACYHNLLNAERRMHAVLGEQQQPGGRPGWREIKDEFRNCVNGVVISGTDRAVDAALAIDALYFPSQPRATGEPIDWDARNALRRGFVDAVRADLGPPKPRP